MAYKVADLVASLELNSASFTKGLKSSVSDVKKAAAEMKMALGKTQQTAIKDTESQVKRSLGGVRSALKDTSRVVTGILISQAFYSALQQVQALAREVAGFSVQLENAGIAFGLMLKDQDKADRFINKLKEFVAVTPFQFEPALKSAQKLVAMGFQIENVIPIMRDLLDLSAVSGGNPELLNRLTLAIGQINTAGRLRGGEVKQLIEAGLPVIEILNEELGYTTEQLSDIGRLRIPAETAITAILTGIQKRYGGASELLAQTLTGLLSTAKDNALQLAVFIFEGTFEGIKRGATRVKEFLDQALLTTHQTGLGGLFESIVPKHMQQTFRLVVGIFKQLGSAIKELLSAVKPLAVAIGEYLLRYIALLVPP